MNLKKSILCLVLYFIFGQSRAQSNDKHYGPREFGLSSNLSLNVIHAYNKNTYGYGYFVYFHILNKKNVTLLSGMEINVLRFKQDEAHLGQMASYIDVTNSTHIFTLPIIVRFASKKRIQLFYECGADLNFRFIDWSKGTYSGMEQNNSGQWIPFSRKENPASVEFDHNRIFNPGFINSLGIIIPVKKIDFVLKGSYEYGIIDVAKNYSYIHAHTQLVKVSLGIKRH